MQRQGHEWSGLALHGVPVSERSGTAEAIRESGIDLQQAANATTVELGMSSCCKGNMYRIITVDYLCTDGIIEMVECSARRDHLCKSCNSYYE